MCRQGLAAREAVILLLKIYGRGTGSFFISFPQLDISGAYANVYMVIKVAPHGNTRGIHSSRLMNSGYEK
jgi:hypothetical protein